MSILFICNRDLSDQELKINCYQSQGGGPVASCTRWATCKCRSDNPWEVRRSKRELFDLITNEQERKREGVENVGFERSSTDPGGQVGDKEGAKMGYGSIDSVQVISNLAYCAFYVYKH